MLVSRLKLLSFLVFMLFSMSIIYPAFSQTQDYSAGVTKGQYVKYGNFVGIGSNFQEYNNNDWMKYEVVSVNVTVVSLVLTGQFKNGTAFLGNGDTWVYNVILLSMVNGTPISGQNPVIAAKLTKLTPLSPYSFDTGYVNDTQTRTYLGVSRKVNILIYSSETENSSSTLTYIYDQDSGMLLEMKGEVMYSQSSIQQFSYSVTDTNIFGPKSSIPMEYIILTAIIIVVVISVVVFLRVKRSRKRKYGIRIK